MKTKLFLSVFFIQLLISTLFLSNSVAQDYTKWGLPEGAKARLGKGTLSFGDNIAYSPDGTRLAVASRIGIWIYDAQTYQELSLLTGRINRVNSVAFSPDGQTLASGSVDGTVLLWRTTSTTTTDPQSVDAKGKHYTKWGTLKTAEVYQNYPNPFNPETWIPYTLFETSNVKLSIFDTSGELIREFKLGYQTRGPKRIHWDGKNTAGEAVASGIYFYQFEAGNTKSVHKMWLLK